ncbi:MAG: LptF/LptG family permease [Bacteroidales bacterium]|nr:LptF/LptG family permease [Bacteroidales bacterium]
MTFPLLRRAMQALRRAWHALRGRGKGDARPWLGRLDRYIIYKFLSTYIFLITIIVVIAVIFDFNEQIDKLTRSHAPMQKIIFDYYVNFIPYFANLFSPLFVFIAVIFFTSKLADNSEIIAMKSTGMSFRRLLRPYMVSAAIIALSSFLLGAYVIPQTSVERVNFYNRYIKKRSDITSIDNVQMQVDTGVVAYITYFDNVTKRGYGFSLDKFVDKKLVSHLTAQTITYDTLSERRCSWTLQQYHIRTLQGKREKLESGAKLDTIIMMEPKDFFFVRNQQETMTLPQLNEFIDRQKLRGAAGISTFEVEYHKRFAAPFAAFILTLIGVTLSCEKRKGGMGASIGAGIALSFAYILFQTISATFAINAGWPPMLSVWIPNILFAIIAGVLYRRTPQ